MIFFFSEKDLYTTGKLCIKFEACGSNSFGVIVNCVILQGVTHLDAIKCVVVYTNAYTYKVVYANIVCSGVYQGCVVICTKISVYSR